MFPRKKKNGCSQVAHAQNILSSFSVHCMIVDHSHFPPLTGRYKTQYSRRFSVPGAPHRASRVSTHISLQSLQKEEKNEERNRGNGLLSTLNEALSNRK
jgi:hypothetical protein